MRLTSCLLALIGISIPTLAFPAEKLGALTWGMEDWHCGKQAFDLKLGTGGDVLLKAFDGDISATSAPSAVPARRWVRDALVSILPDGPTPATDGRILPEDPNPRINHSAAGNLANIIVKQRGDESVNLPVHRTFDPPVLLKGGRLRAVFDVQTYSGDAARDARIGRQYPEECLDTELQLTVSFQPVEPSLNGRADAPR